MITIERAVFQQLAAQLHASLPGVAAQILENDRIQIVEDGRVVDEFSAADALKALLRWGQVPVPAEADCERMAKNAGIKEAGDVAKPQTRKRGNS